MTTSFWNINDQSLINIHNNMSFQNVVPIIWAICAINCFVTMQVFVKLLSSQISTQYIIYMRSILVFAFNSIFILNSSQYQPYSALQLTQKSEAVQPYYFSFNIKSRSHFLLMLKRQFWNALSVNMLLSSLQHINISIANTLYNLSPIFTFFIQAIYYRKKIDKIKLMIVIISFCGVLIILNPFSRIQEESFNWYLLLPVGASLATCMNYLYLHEMRGNFKELQVLQYTYFLQILSGGLIVSAVGTTESSSQSPNEPLSYLIIVLYMALIVIFAYSSNFLRIKALFKRKPSEVMVFNYTGIIYSIIIDVLVFKNHLNLYQSLGVLMTSAGLLSQFFIDYFQKKQ